MNNLIVLSGLLFGLMGSTYFLADPCFVREQEETGFGANEGIAGKCSNNGASVTCIVGDDGIVTCTGPGGGYSGTDLESLTSSACNCYNDRDRPAYSLKTK